MYPKSWDKLQQTTVNSFGDTLCCWSDLLGFANEFVDSQWNPNKENWEKICERLKHFQKEKFNQLSPMSEFLLMLNDGAAHTCAPQNLMTVAIWVRGLVLTHKYLNKTEFSKGYPGLRSVIAAGTIGRYGFEDLRMDDFYFKNDGEEDKVSTTAAKLGNPIVAYNPSPLQMNTAVSKSYILDGLGSRAGIKGPSVYIDESFFELMRKLIGKESENYVEDSYFDTSSYFRVVKRNGEAEIPWLFGMEMDGPISIDEKRIKTRVYRLKTYFPWDENPKEFKFDLDSFD